MEGNACYKYATLARFLEKSGNAPVRSVLEIGAHVGTVTLEISNCFPDADIFAYEVIDAYAQAARAHTAHRPSIRVINAAVTAAHLYEDDLGQRPRSTPADLWAYLGQPCSGPGYAGGSFVYLPDQDHTPNFEAIRKPVQCVTLDAAVEAVRRELGVNEIDYVKSDCEGSECNFLGAANQDTLSRIRYLAGEYHQLRRFWPVAQKLLETHYVNLIGGPQLGAFFCERRTTRISLLVKEPNEPRVHPTLHDGPLYWHRFDERWILSDERRMHGLE